MQGQPVQILQMLLERPGELVTREELRQRLWASDTFVDFDHSLNTAIKKLRQALADEADTPRYIETLPKRGYRFIGEVQPAVQDVQPAVAYLPKGIQPIEAPAKRSKKRLGMIAAALLAAIIALLFLSYRGSFLPAPRIITTRKLTNTQRIKNSSCCLSTDGSRVYFLEQSEGDRWSLQQVSTAGGEVSEVPTSLKQVLAGVISSPSGSELFVRDCCTNWIVPVPAGSAYRAPLPSESDWMVWTPDGRSLVYSSNRAQDLYRVDADGRNRVRLLSAARILYPRISPDGRRIRYSAPTLSANWNIWEIDIDGGRPHPVFPEMKDDNSYGDWTADGELFVFFRRNGAFKTLWAVREAPLTFRRPKPTLLYAGPLDISYAISSRGSKELYVRGVDPHGRLSVFDPHSSSFVPFLGGIPASFVTFSPDAKWIAYVSYPEGQLWKSRIDGSEKMQLSRPPMGVVNPRWSPDGKLISFMDFFASDGGAIYVVPAEGGQPLLLSSRAHDSTWSPDGHMIAYGHHENDDHHIRILDLDTMHSTEVLGSTGLYSPRWSPDGKYLVALTLQDFSPRLYSFETKQWRSLGSDSTFYGWPAWSHDGKYIYLSGNSEIVRIRVDNGRVEPVVGLKGVAWTCFARDYHAKAWFGLTPDDRVMILRDAGTEEIYALQLEY